MALQVLYRQRSHLVAEPDPLISFMYGFFSKIKIDSGIIIDIKILFFLWSSEK